MPATRAQDARVSSRRRSPRWALIRSLRSSSCIAESPLPVNRHVSAFSPRTPSLRHPSPLPSCNSFCVCSNHPFLRPPQRAGSMAARQSSLSLRRALTLGQWRCSSATVSGGIQAARSTAAAAAAVHHAASLLSLFLNAWRRTRHGSSVVSARVQQAPRRPAAAREARPAWLRAAATRRPPGLAACGRSTGCPCPPGSCLNPSPSGRQRACW